MFLSCLTEDQEASRVTLAEEHLGRSNHDEIKFLNCIVFGDEMTLHRAEPETAMETSWFPTSQGV